MKPLNAFALIAGAVFAICLLMMASESSAGATRLGDIPVMEEMAAGLRAVAAMDPDENIRNPDTMAKELLTPAFWFWTSLSKDFEKSRQYIKFYHLNAYYTQNAVTKHIDGILEAGAGENIAQVVIIGAGLDSRAYRFADRMPGVRFFEVDLPAAVNRKRELVQIALGGLPQTVAYVPVDYRKEAMGAALKRAGYDPKAKTLFICEMVTRYIDAAAVDRVLGDIGENAPAGSQLVFDYIFADIARGDFSKMPGARFLSVRVASCGYPWKFGIVPDQAGQFVESRGFSVLSDLDAGQLAHRYLVRSDGTFDGKPLSFVHIMHAVVK